MAGDLDGDRAQRTQGSDELLDGDAGLVLEVAADRERGEHDGQVRLDGVTLAVEDWTGA